MRLTNLISLSLLTVNATAQIYPQEGEATLFDQVEYIGDESMDIPEKECVNLFSPFNPYLSLKVTNMTCLLYRNPDCDKKGDLLIVPSPGEPNLKEKGWAGQQDGTDLDPYSIYCDTGSYEVPS
ncbi:hypothetical protein GGI43DRAFT_408110 [Trichoderma evansii]